MSNAKLNWQLETSQSPLLQAMPWPSAPWRILLKSRASWYVLLRPTTNERTDIFIIKSTCYQIFAPKNNDLYGLCWPLSVLICRQLSVASLQLQFNIIVVLQTSDSLISRLTHVTETVEKQQLQLENCPSPALEFYIDIQPVLTAVDSLQLLPMKGNYFVHL